MQSYFSTFPAGAETVVERALQKRGPAVLIHNKYSGLITYESNYSSHDIRQIRFFQNSFLLLYETKEALSLREILNKLRTDQLFADRLKKVLPKQAHSFKIVASIENKTVAMPPIQLKKLELHIAKETKLSLAAKYPDTEIWIIQRREGFILAGLRITNPDAHALRPERGELSAQVANLLCLVSEPSSGDIVLDPFAGNGGIIFERAVAFPYEKIIALEKDFNLVKKLKERAKNFDKNIIIEQGNAEYLRLADASVDIIITDPPWGIYGKEDVSELYAEMLRECQRVLTREGRLVVLTGAKEVFEKTLKNISGVEIIDKTDVLVSGKKAAIYKIGKT